MINFSSMRPHSGLTVKGTLGSRSTDPWTAQVVAAMPRFVDTLDDWIASVASYAALVLRADPRFSLIEISEQRAIFTGRGWRMEYRS